MNSKLSIPTVICFGEVLWDVLPSGPEPGGAPLNVAYHLNKLGISTGIMSRIGNDEEGRKLFSLISEWGINTSLLQTDNEQPTSRVIASLNDNNEVSYEIGFPVAWDFIAESNSLGGQLAKANYLVYGSLASRNEVTRNTLFSLLESSTIKIFDVNLRPPFIETGLLHKLLQKADIIKFNQAELEKVQELFNGSFENQAAKAAFVINTFGAQMVIVTKGATGASCYTANSNYHTPGKPVEVNDTIGSGDAFLASFVAGLVNGDDPAENLKDAVAMGAFITTKKGGCPAYDLPELYQFKHRLMPSNILTN